MYQIKFQNGYEIQVLGKGENGLCRVVNANYVVLFTGTYAECEKWLNARAVAIAKAGGQNYADQSARPYAINDAVAHDEAMAEAERAKYKPD